MDTRSPIVFGSTPSDTRARRLIASLGAFFDFAGEIGRVPPPDYHPFFEEALTTAPPEEGVGRDPQLGSRVLQSAVSLLHSNSADHARTTSRHFDLGWYLEQAAAKQLTITDHPVVDYLLNWRMHGLSPNRLFDHEWYKESYMGFGPCPVSPFEHYLLNDLKNSPNPFFDPEYYLAQSGVGAKIDHPLLHFSTHGWKDGLAPSELFDVTYYLAAYKDIEEWGVNPLFHFVQWGFFERRIPVKNAKIVPSDDELRGTEARYYHDVSFSGRYNSYKIRLARSLNQKFASALRSVQGLCAELDRSTAQGVDNLPRAYYPSVSPLFEFGRTFLAEPLATSEIWILTSWLKRGGAERVIANLCRCFERIWPNQRINVITTDFVDLECVEWLGGNVNVLPVVDNFPEISDEDRAKVLVQSILFAEPKLIINVNSRTGWNVYDKFGHILKDRIVMWAALFCHDYTDGGIPVGYAVDHFATTVNHVHRTFGDHEGFLSKLCSDSCLDKKHSEKFCWMYQPVDPVNFRVPANLHESPRRIAWAGRSTKQKRVELALAVAEAAPNWEFDFFGVDPRGAEKIPANATLRGAYDTFGDVVGSRPDAFLYTSAWDGLPNVLLEAAAAGLPVIAPDVGGIAELIGESTGFLVRDHDRIEGYVEALAKMAGDYASALGRASALQLLLQRRHSWDQSTEILALWLKADGILV